MIGAVVIEFNPQPGRQALVAGLILGLYTVSGRVRWHKKSLIQFGGAMRAACGLERYGCETVGAFFGRGGFFRLTFIFALMESINSPD